MVNGTREVRMPALGWASPKPLKKKRSNTRIAVNLAALLGLTLVVGELIYIFGAGNLREVIPGRIYRSSQPNPAYLDRLIAKHGIRTVFNLRGCCDPTAWYLAEAGAAQKAGISLEDFSFSAGRLPSTKVLKRLVEAIDHAEEPILIHCHQGIDRTGMVAALWLLLRTQTTFEEALPQLSLRYAHLNWGRTGNLDRFMAYYGDYLQENELVHRPEILRDWIERIYIPGAGKVRMELRDPNELEIAAGHPAKIGIRCINESLEPWVLRPGNNAGHHLYWYIVAPGSRQTMYAGLSGLFETSVPPGDSIVLEVPVPGHIPPGDYLLRTDMDEPWHARFAQLTGSIMEETIRIRHRTAAVASVPSHGSGASALTVNKKNNEEAVAHTRPASESSFIQGRNLP